MGFDWKKVVGGIAPTLAGALGGPAAKAAVSAISKALLGRDDAPESEIAAAISQGATIEQIAALKAAENDFNAKLLEYGVDLATLEMQDRASARKRQVEMHDLLPSVLGTVVIVGFLAMAYMVLTGRVNLSDPTVVGMVGTVIGYVSAKADTVIGYYFGTSFSSRKKDETISRALDK